MIWPPIISSVDKFCLLGWPFEKHYKANFEGKVPVVSQMAPVEIERRVVCDLCYWYARGFVPTEDFCNASKGKILSPETSVLECQARIYIATAQPCSGRGNILIF